MIDATNCPHCGKFSAPRIQFTYEGEPFWVCRHCGVMIYDRRWYKYVAKKEATEIVEYRGRRGLFVLDTGAGYIGIDNSTGDAWFEEFPDLFECLMWLAGEKEAEE